MRRGRGKGKKQNVSTREDRGNEEEEKIPAYRRRGRPHKPMKDDYFEEEEEEVDMVEDEEEEEEEIDDANEGSITSKNREEGRKRKLSNGTNTDTTDEENVLGSKTSTNDFEKSTSSGFRQSRNRRKSKPRRAAEAVVECNGV